MSITKRRPVNVSEILTTEFLEPLEVTPEALAEAMDVPINTVSDLLNGGTLTAPLAIKLSAAFGTSAEFWLKLQHMLNLWDARNCYEDEAKTVKPLRSGEDTELFNSLP